MFQNISPHIFKILLKIATKSIFQEAKTNENRINALTPEEESLYFSTSKDKEARIHSKSDYMSPMQKTNSEGSETEQKSFLSAYQESLMSTCSEIIDSLTSEKDSDGLSKNIKIERSGSTEQDDWISGFDTSISTEPTKETSVTIKQELQLGKEICVMLDSNKPMILYSDF